MQACCLLNIALNKRWLDEWAAGWLSSYCQQINPIYLWNYAKYSGLNRKIGAGMKPFPENLHLWYWLKLLQPTTSTATSILFEFSLSWSEASPSHHHGKLSLSIPGISVDEAKKLLSERWTSLSRIAWDVCIRASLSSSFTFSTSIAHHLLQIATNCVCLSPSAVPQSVTLK